MLSSIYLRLKLFIEKHTKIIDVYTTPFFSQPNSFDNTRVYLIYIKQGIPRINLSSPYSRILHGIVDKRANFIVFSTPKVSSTTIRIFAQEKLNLSLEKGPPHRVEYKTLLDSSSLKSKSRTELNFNKYIDYKMFIVMRDPTERIISFFLDKIINKINDADLEIKRVADNFLQMLFKNQFYVDYNELTFKKFIDAFVLQYYNGGKIWDVHIAPQITADLKEIAQNQLQIISMNNCNDFLNYWHLQSTGTSAQYTEHYNKSWDKTDSKFIPNGYDIQIKDLISLKNRIHPDSFIYPELIEAMRVIYKDDYEFWDKVKSVKDIY